MNKKQIIWKHKHLIGLRDFSREEIEYILDTAHGFEEVSTRNIKKAPTLRGKVVVNLFFEDSTRTRNSFTLAANRLSADVIEFTEKVSSTSKGETLLDTARNLEAMGIDIVVIRQRGRRSEVFKQKYKRLRCQCRRRLLRTSDTGTFRRLYNKKDKRQPRRA
jgi:aspartate carbamoyltransferase catalytic subunit